MNHAYTSFFALCFIASLGSNAIADDTSGKSSEVKNQGAKSTEKSQREKNRIEFRNKSPEEREAMRKAMRDHLANMSPEERALLNEELRKDHKKIKTENKSNLRKEMHDHALNNLTPEQRAEMHKNVQAYMQSLHQDERAVLREEYDKMTPEQRAERRKELHDHANDKMTSDELEEMHSRVRANMQNKAGAQEKK